MNRELRAQRVLIALILLALLLVLSLMRPFAQAFVFATVLATTLYPIHLWLTKKWRGRASWSAAALSVLVIFSLLLPLGGIGAFVINEAIHGARFVSETVQSEGMTGLLERLPDSLQGIADHVVQTLSLDSERIDQLLRKHASTHGGKLAAVVSDALSATGAVAVQVTMMMIAFFFLLVDGAALVSWIEKVSPLRPGQASELLAEFRKVSVSVLVSSVVTSGVQALAALVGYLVFGVPHPFFFATVTFFVAFIPAVGAGGVCLSAAVLLLALGHPWSALFLTLWGVFVVGLVDNLVKPLLVKRGVHIHGAIVFFSLLGGLAVLGSVGLLLGPLIVAFLLALVRIYMRDFGSNDSVVLVSAEEPRAGSPPLG